MGNQKRREPYGHPRGLASPGVYIALPELARPVGRHLIALDKSFQVGGPATQAYRHALNRTPLVDRKKVAADHEVVHLRNRRLGRSDTGKPHHPNLLGELLRDLHAELAVQLDLVGSRRYGGHDLLVCQRGVGQHAFGVATKS